MQKQIAGLVIVAALSLVSLGAGRSYAKCADDDPTGALRAAARQDVKDNCNCATAENHGAYVKCSAGRVNANTSLPKSCRGAVKKCAAKSNCGKPGFIICCKKNSSGKTTCAAKKDCDHCVAPSGGSKCCSANSSCCCQSGASFTGTCDDTPACSCASPSGAFLGSAGGLF